MLNKGNSPKIMPYCRIQTALTRTQYHPFHHGPVSPCNKIKYQAFVFRLDKTNSCLLFNDTGPPSNDDVLLRVNFISVIAKKQLFTRGFLFVISHTCVITINKCFCFRAGFLISHSQQFTFTILLCCVPNFLPLLSLFN